MKDINGRITGLGVSYVYMVAASAWGLCCLTITGLWLHWVIFFANISAVAQTKFTPAYSIQTPMKNSLISASPSSLSGQQIAVPTMMNHLEIISRPSHEVGLQPTSFQIENQWTNGSKQSETLTATTHMNEKTKNHVIVTATSTERPDSNIINDISESDEDDTKEDDAQEEDADNDSGIIDRNACAIHGAFGEVITKSL
ncbi:hypothetical protein PV327_011306 [Microctonus hyperodae]|uniref:Uncharacterized protein n=1 Tax=Microctonus hyperodae TaxID=165561 RepID=A0AA39C3L2_MICHY|nr:hypothetical protein PV327_011306 [Microctonus hyperodae]